MRGTASLLMGTSKAKAICCAMRGDPQLGFRRFILDDGSHHVAAGPRWPGLFRTAAENSRRHFRVFSAR